MFLKKYVAIEGCPAAVPQFNSASAQSANVDRYAPGAEHGVDPTRGRARFLHCAPEIQVKMVR
jgi:hypothetical protein